MQVQVETIGIGSVLIGTLAFGLRLLIKNVVKTNERLLNELSEAGQKQIDQHGKQTEVLQQISANQTAHTVAQKTMCDAQDKMCHTLEDMDRRRSTPTRRRRR